MKLTSFERQGRKNYKIYFGKGLILKTCGRVTFAFIKTGPGRGKIAWSIHSKTDGKFHRKYGEYLAMKKLHCQGMPVEFFAKNGEDMRDILWDMTNIIIPDL